VSFTRLKKANHVLAWNDFTYAGKVTNLLFIMLSAAKIRKRNAASCQKK
jgi:hypothetical protein